MTVCQEMNQKTRVVVDCVQKGKGKQMILVDVYVPAVDQEYNFSLNENVSVAAISSEIIEMIEHKEQTRLHGDANQMLLCDKRKGSVLSKENTLRECGVLTGDSLLLV